MADNNQSPRAQDAPLIRIEDMRVHFGPVKAVDGISFDIRRGETLGLVGESGSGKTTVGRAILRALDDIDGKLRFTLDDTSTDLRALRGEKLRAFRKHMQLIFQDPYSSLNPRMTVRDIIAEPLEAGAERLSKSEIDTRVREIAQKCRLNLEHLRRFPHAFSGGQRQRICIARALVSNPEFVVCDESVSALDVSIQADILNLLMDLQDELNTTYLFIAHDLSVVAQISDRVAVMYVGQLMELTDTVTLFERPLHPYTKALFSAIPRLDPQSTFEPVRLAGDIPNPSDPPPGCRFSTRCPFARDRCRSEQPAWREVQPGHLVACHFAEDLADEPRSLSR
ncbi:MAG: ATP-binding cassette domain-containing protein [Geminicoccaceae bacterium]|nr:ATP-binding cassette domain-containing protein [Geminicoccaceae bacterium]